MPFRGAVTVGPVMGWRRTAPRRVRPRPGELGRRLDLAAKRGLDVVGALALVALLAPVLVLAALAVACEAGPRAVLFAQERGGRGGRAFRILKLRTMRVAEDGAVVEPVRPGDRRVTRAGRLLRRSSLDELPQLWNVLVGEMSLVGPRPHATAHDRTLAAAIPGYAGRNRLRPGLTGWAQVHGHRGPAPTLEAMRARVALDLWYVENRSLALDLLILARTLPAVLSGRNAV
jgi:putative colanic acid biosysnthesis UDP-glucose lipid carrier transferase